MMTYSAACRGWCKNHDASESELVAHIAEVDERRLYAGEACSSMFVYCTEVLHMSEAEAYLRIRAARASRKHPVLLKMLEDGRIHLTGVAKLSPYLTEANRETVLSRAEYKSKARIEELVAEISPKPDVAPTIRKLPASPKAQTTPAAQLRPDAVASPCPTPANADVVKPLAPARYKIQFTASAELKDKIHRLRALMRSSVPDGDLAAIISRHFAVVTLHSGPGQARSQRARRAPMHLRGRTRKTVQRARQARIPPRRALWPWRRPQPGERQDDVSRAQRVSSRARLRERGNGAVSTFSRPRQGARACLKSRAFSPDQVRSPQPVP